MWSRIFLEAFTRRKATVWIYRPTFQLLLADLLAVFESQNHLSLKLQENKVANIMCYATISAFMECKLRCPTICLFPLLHHSPKMMTIGKRMRRTQLGFTWTALQTNSSAIFQKTALATLFINQSAICSVLMLIHCQTYCKKKHSMKNRNQIGQEDEISSLEVYLEEIFSNLPQR